METIDKKDKERKQVKKTKKTKKTQTHLEKMNPTNIQIFLDTLVKKTDLENPIYQEFLRRKNTLEQELLTDTREKYQDLYPSLFDKNFNVKIAQKKEFHDLIYDEPIKNVNEEADRLCNAEVELSTYQTFVRNFLSSLTPYNSLLLYHGLGVGKTCSAISVCEEMRDYMKQLGVTKRIIIVASPNVQTNFKTQLFDERKLKLVNDVWSLKGCTGNKMLKEINPTFMKGIPREKIIRQIKRIINQYYIFMGYQEFSNYITKIKSSYIDEDKRKERKKRIMAIQKEFENRLIVIDEVHNIRGAGLKSSADNKIEQNFLDIVTYAKDLKLLFLSATPMFNSYKEIIWLLNLMLLNDKRPQIELSDIFDTKGRLKEIDGEKVLIEKSRGYISFVRGENPYTFPYRIYPLLFDKDRSILNEEMEYPEQQINRKKILQKMDYVDVYLDEIGDYQKIGYEIALENIRRDLPDEEGVEYGLGWTKLEGILQSLNMVYPNRDLDAYNGTPINYREMSMSMSMSEERKQQSIKDINIDVRDFIGKNGITSVMNYDEKTYRDFEYKPEVLEKYGKLFSPEIVGTYSGKIKNIVETIKKSEGIVLIYSQYIDGGCLPVALALESIGITRYGDSKNSLFKTPETTPLNVHTMKPYTKDDTQYSPAKYIMITGTTALSPNNEKEIKASTNDDNKNGEKVKVVIISAAGSEGIDFRYIRQVHILEPWYNMSRIEQIIGRGVRFCSHKDLEFSKRNVEIYLHTTRNYNQEEPADMYVYRMAEKKAIQIGKVARVLKENAVDCMINIQYNDLTAENMNQTVKLELSSGKTITYNVGDKPFSQVCDYMERCTYKCYPFDKDDTVDDKDVTLGSYNENFIVFNVDKVIQKIKDAFKQGYIYKKQDLIKEINRTKKYPDLQINYALQILIEQDNEFIVDMLGRLGRLINVDSYYMFQPVEINDHTISRFERVNPVEYKRDVLDVALDDKLSTYVLRLDEYPELKEKDEEDTERASLEKAKDRDKEKVVSKTKSKKETTKSKKETTKSKKETTKSKKETPSKSELFSDERTRKILTMIEDNYTISKTTDVVGRGDLNWYKHASLTIQKLSQELDVERKVFEQFIVEHIVDTLLFETKKHLIEYIQYKIHTKKEFTTLETQIKRYIENALKVTTEEKVEGFLLYSDKLSVYTYNKDSFSLEKPLPLDEMALLKEVISNKHNINDYNNILGFMGYIDKTNEIVFKTKYIELKRNKGARCDQAGKAFSIKISNDIFGEERYTTENTKSMKAPQLCSEQELLLRYYNSIQKDGKVWFLNVEQGVANTIDTLFRSKK